MPEEVEPAFDIEPELDDVFPVDEPEDGAAEELDGLAEPDDDVGTGGVPEELEDAAFDEEL